LRALRFVPALALVAALAGCGSHTSDPPVFVPWHRVGDIRVGEPSATLVHDYGRSGQYRIHRGKVWVTFRGGRVTGIGFTTPYYRTKTGFGVGSRVHADHLRRKGFVYDAWNKDRPCNCWTKVGRSARSLPATGANFLKPWLIIYVNHSRVRSFYFDLKFVD
jgi:hypothetical protein